VPRRRAETKQKNDNDRGAKKCAQKVMDTGHGGRAHFKAGRRRPPSFKPMVFGQSRPTGKTGLSASVRNFTPHFRDVGWAVNFKELPRVEADIRKDVGRE